MKSSKSPLILLSCALATVACRDTTECKRLREVLAANEKVLSTAELRAKPHDMARQKAEAAEKRATKLLADLGLDRAEESLAEELTARVARIPGATIERGTRTVGGPAAGVPMVEHQTMWSIAWSAADPAKVLGQIDDLLGSPPLFQFVALVRGPKASRWTLEIGRVAIDRVAARPPPALLDAREDPAAIASEFGFCGAAKLREKIADVGRSIAAIEEAAKETSVLLPLAATYSGLARRTEAAERTEKEARRIAKAFIAAAVAANVPFNIVGVEDKIVVFELVGGDRERKRLEAKLPHDVLASIQPLEDHRPNIVRLSAPNRAAEPTSHGRPGGSAMHPAAPSTNEAPDPRP